MKTTRCTNENLVKRLLLHIFCVWVRFLLFFSSVNENGKVLYSRLLVSKMWNAKLQTENLENLKTVNGRRQTAVEMKISMLAGVWGKQESKKTPDPPELLICTQFLFPVKYFESYFWSIWSMRLNQFYRHTHKHIYTRIKWKQKLDNFFCNIKSTSSIGIYTGNSSSNQWNTLESIWLSSIFDMRICNVSWCEFYVNGLDSAYSHIILFQFEISAFYLLQHPERWMNYVCVCVSGFLACVSRVERLVIQFYQRKVPCSK